MSEIDTSASVGITEEMRVAAIEAAKADPEIRTMAGRGAGVFHALPSIVDVALRAALAGRTSLELPQPTGKWSDGVPYWDAENRVVAAQVDESGRPYTRLNGQIWLVTEAEAVGLALVAAAREARRLASGFSESGEPT